MLFVSILKYSYLPDGVCLGFGPLALYCLFLDAVFSVHYSRF